MVVRQRQGPKLGAGLLAISLAACLEKADESILPAVRYFSKIYFHGWSCRDPGREKIIQA